MPLLPRVSSLWRNLFDKANVERELADELRAHLDLLTETKINRCAVRARLSIRTRQFSTFAQ
jgi:hypothetical protein